MFSPVNAQIVLLRPRIPVLVGTLIALNAPVQIGVCESLTPRGQLTIPAFQSGLSGVTISDSDINKLHAGALRKNAVEAVRQRRGVGVPR
jgi:hypothetical protein